LGAQPRGAVLQWATAFVAIFLVLVIAGDIFLGARLAAPDAQPEIAMLSKEAPGTVVTVVVESETVLERPETQEATEEGAPVEPTAEAPRMLVAPTPMAEAEEVGKPAEPGEMMGGGGPPTGTKTLPPMTVDETPVKGLPAETAPERGDQGNVLPDGTPPSTPDIQQLEQQVPPEGTTTTGAQEQHQETPAETPLAMAPPSDIRASEQSREPGIVETPRQEISPNWPALLARAGWRVAEVGLGLLLLGLIVFMVWERHRN
jgi:hypothetical protein